MLKRREIPNKPRFRYVIEKAHELLLELGITEFPVNIQDVIDELSDQIDIISYTKAKVIMKSEDPFNLHKLHTEARTLKLRHENLALIIYDDTLRVPYSRLRWSIMHEIAHVVLGHLDDFELTRLDRKANSDYGVLEVEANYFVSEFLMPTPVISCMQCPDPETIVKTFEVSEEAAIKKYSKLPEISSGSYRYSELLYQTFYNFLHPSIMESELPEVDYPELECWNYLCEKISGSSISNHLTGSRAFYNDDILVLYIKKDPYEIRVNEHILLNAVKKYTNYNFTCLNVLNIPGTFKLDSSWCGEKTINKSPLDILTAEKFEL